MEFISNKKDFSIDDIEGGFFWRYLDIFQLISLLESKTIYFSKADKFEDITECMSDKGFSEISFGESYMKISNPKIFEATGKSKTQYLDDGEVIISQEISKAKNAQQFHFISCWHYANRESIAMWKQYSKDKGFAIKISAKLLFKAIKNSIKNNPSTSDWESMTYGFVKYRKLTPFDHFCDKNKEYLDNSNQFLGYNKDISYEHEKEFRFIAIAKKNTYEAFTTKIEDYIDSFELIGSPNLKTWELNAANKAISQISKTHIEKSSIYFRDII